MLQTLIFSEKQIDTNDGRWFAVRIMPYRTMEGVIGGVTITFSNITATKMAETKLLEECAKLRSRLGAELQLKYEMGKKIFYTDKVIGISHETQQKQGAAGRRRRIAPSCRRAIGGKIIFC